MFGDLGSRRRVAGFAVSERICTAGVWRGLWLAGKT